MAISKASNVLHVPIPNKETAYINQSREFASRVWTLDEIEPNQVDQFAL